MRVTALACGHWVRRGDAGEVPGACPECGEQAHPLVTWPLDAEGNRVLWRPWPVPDMPG